MLKLLNNVGKNYIFQLLKKGAKATKKMIGKREKTNGMELEENISLTFSKRKKGGLTLTFV